jgi:hypothetical protein
MPHLPTELTDVFIDFHHSDRKTLSVCSLVCRNWLSRSRFHLFGTVCVNSSDIHSFVDLLASPWSTIVSSIHTLHIYLQDTSVDIPVFDIIAPHFEDFVAIKYLTLNGRQWVPISEESLSRGFGRTRNLELTSVSYDFFDQWLSLSFTLGNGGTFTFSPSLRVLHSALDGSQQPPSWLPMVAQLPAVSRVDLRVQESDLPTIRTVLKSGGQSIHTIKLRFPFERSVIGTSKRLRYKLYRLLLVYSFDQRLCRFDVQYQPSFIFHLERQPLPISRDRRPRILPENYPAHFVAFLYAHQD